MTDTFDPQRAMETLRNNAIQISELGAEIEKLRLEHLVAMAELMDAEEVCRYEIFTDTQVIKAYQLRDWIKWKTAAQLKKEAILSEKIRILKDKMDVLVEVNNSLKASHRITMMEANNLNLT